MTVAAAVAPDHVERAERLRGFAAELDAVRARVDARLGEEDGRYIRRVRRLSTAMEIAGRSLIHVSPEPITFAAGVVALWIHMQLETGEIGHSALHGAFDGLPGAGRFAADRFTWLTPIDEVSWIYGHNVRHHVYTNVTDRDPDIHFGPVRLNAQSEHRPHHRAQLLYSGLESLHFTTVMNLHVTGIVDAVLDNGRPARFDFLKDRSWPEVRGAVWRASRKLLPYLLKNYVLFPALAGPLFWKVMLGNWLAGTLRDVYSAATVHCGHVGAEVKDYPPGTRARSRGEWYAMQVESTNNFEVPRPVSQLCGALNRQIEHHLFPHLPPNRLREIAPEVRAICERHGVQYRTDTWGRTLARVIARLHALSRPAPKA